MESNGNWSGLRAEETLDCGCIRSFLLSFFEFFETCVRKSTSLVSSWFHLLLFFFFFFFFFFISLRRRFPLPSFLPSVVPFHFEWPLPPSREPQPSSVSPLPPPLSSLPSQTSFPAVRRKNSLKKTSIFPPFPQFCDQRDSMRSPALRKYEF